MSRQQNPHYTCKTRQEVIDVFGPAQPEWQIDTVEATEKVFGSCETLDFEKKNLEKMILPGFGVNGEQTKTLKMHRQLKDLLLSAFSRIQQARLDYILDPDQAWGQTFRYKKNKTTQKYLKNRSEYEHLKAQMSKSDWDSWGWAIRTAQYDAQHGKLGELIDIESRQVAKKTLLSNHAFGTAIDLNSGSNPYSSAASFDMSKDIIGIMAQHGFRWGGYYHDYMHFEYVLDHIIPIPNSTTLCLPVDYGNGIAGTQANWSNFVKKKENELNSSFVGNHNLTWNQGLSLFGEERQSIHACFDGTIEAARLSSQPPHSEGSGGSQNFILLRHSIAHHEFFCLYRFLYSKAVDEQDLSQMKVKWLYHPIQKYYQVAKGKSVAYRSAPGVRSNPDSQKLGVLSEDSCVLFLCTEKDPGGDPWLKVQINPQVVGYIFQGAADRGDLIMMEKSQLNSELLSDLQTGDILPLDVEVKAGDSLWGMGCCQKEDRSKSMIHWEIFSTEQMIEGIQGKMMDQQDPQTESPIWNLPNSDPCHLQELEPYQWWSDHHGMESVRLPTGIWVYNPIQLCTALAGLSLAAKKG